MDEKCGPDRWLPENQIAAYRAFRYNLSLSHNDHLITMTQRRNEEAVGEIQLPLSLWGPLIGHVTQMVMRFLVDDECRDISVDVGYDPEKES
jgi:hypothetical protein